MTRQWLLVAALAAALAGIHAARRRFGLFSLLVLPGTFAHECSHWLVGLLLNGQPRSFSLMPRREGRGWILGSVTLGHPRWYNVFFVGMAPLLLLPLAYGLMRWRMGLPPGALLPEALIVYFIANLIHSALPSGQDLKVASRSPVGWILLLLALFWGWSAWRGRNPLPFRLSASGSPEGPRTPGSRF